jgi:hypothetical protein
VRRAGHGGSGGSSSLGPGEGWCTPPLCPRAAYKENVSISVSDPDPSDRPRIRIRIPLSSSKNSTPPLCPRAAYKQCFHQCCGSGFGPTVEAVEALLLQIQAEGGVHHHCVPVPPKNVSVSVAYPDPSDRPRIRIRIPLSSSKKIVRKTLIPAVL